MAIFWQKLLNDQRSNTWEKAKKTAQKSGDLPCQKKVPAHFQTRTYYTDTPQNSFYLTERERECILYLTRGMTLVQASDRLNLSYRTVEFYMKRLRDRLGCSTKNDMLMKIHKSSFGKAKDLPPESS